MRVPAYYYRASVILLTTGFSGLASAAVSTGAAVAPSRPVVADPVNAGSVMQLLAGLILVVALILLLGWLVKRYSGLPGQNRALRVVATLPLSTRERLVLVQAGEQQLLLGVTPGQVNLLKSYDQPLIEPGAAMGDFASRLQQAMSRKGAE
ncbi:flagellar biosynthetic protein FliO [Amphritea pacifica]|uniref:Flagellar protein n=1 Tax=Amphritea pacifica TaxID=2811233 RepID=A0ABS2W5Q6_9GAMM|nr:flagellar biosynthetic protein FliO [Amphritea pacifica]MBN0986832.1 flagellar biosynthetic protein FliO [Amphritea pacifica]MBN1005273.1 flagellar biosynthetic protein FliO [Amphritea pacifica]